MVGRHSALIVTLLLGTLALSAQDRSGAMVEWRYVGASQGASKYSPVADIDRSNVDQIEVAWTWEPNELPNQEFNTRPGSFEATALMIENVVYVATMYTRIVALDAETGEELWAFDPEAYRTGPRGAGPGGFKHRGVAVWGTGDDMRVFINSRDRLHAVRATNGEAIRSFGENGHVTLTEDFPNPVTRDEFDQTCRQVQLESFYIKMCRNTIHHLIVSQFFRASQYHRFIFKFFIENCLDQIFVINTNLI